MDSKRSTTTRSDGLEGDWLSLEEVVKLDFFQGTDRDLKIKLNANFGTRPPSKHKSDAETPSPEPGIRAAVKRQYQTGDIICKAGEYGSTAFLILTGTAVAEVPATSSPATIRSRRPRALQRLRSMFKRRTRRVRAADPGDVETGEISAFATVSCDRPPPQRHLGPGDFFGIDACINQYPRESTVRAEQDCVVLEMLRSVLDSIRAYGDSGERINAVYRDNAVCTQLALSSLSRGLDDAQMRRLVAACELLTTESPEVLKGIIYTEGDVADALYLVRAGNIRLTRHGADGDFVFAYLGRGSVFGFEGLVAQDDTHRLELRCVSHPQQFAVRNFGDGMSFGRNPSCDVAFPRDRRAVGRQHCHIELRGEEFVLLQGSTQSLTLLNGEPVSEAVLAAGDLITIADYTFEVAHATPDPAAAEAPPMRRATAAGLDNFEIVKIGRAQLKELAAENEALAATIRNAAPALRTAAAPSLQPSTAITDELLRLDLYNSQNVLLIDLDRCTRCDECVRACADAHDGVTRFTRDGPRFGKYLVAMACRSCTDPKCMIGCPVGSIRRESSLEIRIEDWCIGCQNCAKQCPFGNINMVNLLGDESAGAESPAAADSPIDLHTGSMRAVVCDLCAGHDGPNCVYACPHDAAIRVNPTAYLGGEDLH
jgi:Fe-S-cluster-containing hydrogenase component 2/CRP-like cAMP-binding protein